MAVKCGLCRYSIRTQHEEKAVLRQALSTALTIIIAMLSPAFASQPEMKVTLLGTGSPIPLPDRFGPSTLVQAGGHNLLFDAGRGLTIRLYQIGVSMSTVDPLFITHYRRSARLLIQKHGAEEALSVAAGRAADLAVEGDQKGALVWKAITECVREWSRERGAEDALN
jgi:hypothetical protein